MDNIIKLIQQVKNSVNTSNDAALATELNNQLDELIDLMEIVEIS